MRATAGTTAEQTELVEALAIAFSMVSGSKAAGGVYAEGQRRPRTPHFIILSFFSQKLDMAL